MEAKERKIMEIEEREREQIDSFYELIKKILVFN